MNLKKPITNLRYKVLIGTIMLGLSTMGATTNYKSHKKSNEVMSMLEQAIPDYNSEKYSEFAYNLNSQNLDLVCKSAQGIIETYRNELMEPMKYEGPVFTAHPPVLPEGVAELDSLYHKINNIRI